MQKGNRFKDLTGQIFGRLTVIERVETHIQPNGLRVTKWLCKCDCENKNEIIVCTGALKSKNTQSCGCLQKELLSKRMKKYNTYDLTGEYGIGYTLKGEEFYFDLEDYNKIKDYCWCKDNNGYIYYKSENEFIRMHRLIMGSPYNMEVDHIYHNLFDNRKKFLRIVTPSQNQMNRIIASNNTSGVKGVYWNDKREKWTAQIGVNYKRINLGGFDNFEDAVEARLLAEQKYHIDYRYNPEAEKIINKKQNINI